MPKYLKTSILIILIILPTILCAETHVSSYVSGEWNTAGSPYILDSTIVISYNDSLLIQPGVTVHIGANDSIKVMGTFNAIGAETDSIYFLPAENDSTWKIIYFSAQANPNNQMQYCRLEEAGGYLIKTFNRTTFSNCTFICEEYAIVGDGDDGSVLDCKFITDGFAISTVAGSNQTISGNDFTECVCGIDGFFASGTFIDNVMDNNNPFAQLVAMSNVEVSGNTCGGWFSLQASNGNITGNNFGGSVDIDGSNLTISENQIDGQFDCTFGGSQIEILNNNFNYVGMGSGLYIRNADNLLVQYNQILDAIQTDDCTNFICRDNVFHGASFSMGDCEVVGNSSLSGYFNFGGGCDAILDSNYIEGNLYIGEDTFVEARNNEILWLTGVYRDEIVWVQGNLIFENNTVVSTCYSTFITELVYVEDIGTLTLTNNIIVGDNVNSTGLKVDNGGVVDNSYNCFWKCDVVYEGCEAGIGEFYADPYLVEGSPFDPGLQAISPCIDSGDPSSPNDPDGIRNDMGYRFFDNRYDHAPTVYSDTSSIASQGQEYVYWAKASDDGNNLTFSFEDLPGWLITPSARTIADSIELTGNVPGTQSDFDFLIRVEDSFGQIDTQRVFVESIPHSVISGILTGILPVSGSPYLMTADVIVPVNECLTIEPGVEIDVRRSPEPDGKFAIMVHGQILAEGTESDTIIFTSAEEEPEYDWAGIQLIKCREDTSKISFCRLEHTTSGSVRADSSSLFYIRNNIIEENLFGLYLFNHSGGQIYNCYFDKNEYGSLRIQASSLEIFNNHFADSSYYSIFVDSSDVYIHDNLFTGFSGVKINYNSKPLIAWNTFYNMQEGGSISISNGSEPIIVNNTIKSFGGGIYFYYNTNPVIMNNIIADCNGYGIMLSSIGTPPDTFNIKYNNVWNNAGGNFVDFPDSLGYGQLASVNINGDSCDIFFNISTDPMFEGGDPFSFVLTDGSPCIDAGHPDTSYYDNEDPQNPGFALYPAKGTIINDMGRYGGHGTSFWMEVFDRETGSHLEAISLRQNYPNPFNSSTRIEFDVPKLMKVNITVYDILGRETAVLADKLYTPGTHSIDWNASDYSSGIYFLRMRTDNYVRSRKVVLVK